MKNKCGNQKYFLRILYVSAILCGTFYLSGCSPSEPEKVIGTVTITVTHQGKPVTEGSVNLVILGSAKTANGELNDTGTVTMKAVEAGSYTVSILPPDPPMPDPTKPAVPIKKYTNIPNKFRSETTSPLKADVKQGKNEFNFDLKGK